MRKAPSGSDMYAVAEGKSRGVRVGDIIDGFGEAFMALHRGEPSDHVIERDDGYVTGTDVLTNNSLKPLIKEMKAKGVLEERSSQFRVEYDIWLG